MAAKLKKMTTEALMAEAKKAAAADDFDRLDAIDAELIRREAVGEIPEADAQLTISAHDLLHDAGLWHRTYPNWPHAEPDPEPVPATRILACVNSKGEPGHARTSDGQWGFDLSEQHPSWREAFWNPGRGAGPEDAAQDLDECAAWVDSGQAAEVLAEVKSISEREG